MFKNNLSCLVPILLDSERSDECIDFTMMCVCFFLFYFFLYLSSRFGVVILFLFLTSAPLWIGKFIYLVLWGVKSKHFQMVFKKSREKQKKSDRKTAILRKTTSTKSIFWFCCNSKTNHCKYLKFSPNVYIMVISLQLNFQNILTIFKLLIDNWNFRLF